MIRTLLAVAVTVLPLGAAGMQYHQTQQSVEAIRMLQVAEQPALGKPNRPALRQARGRAEAACYNARADTRLPLLRDRIDEACTETLDSIDAALKAAPAKRGPAPRR